MKRLLIAATLLFAAGFMGCAKSDDAPMNKDIKVEFSVAGKDCFNTTRAVKSDWANGDQILILFKTGDNWLGKENSKDNTITLTYNASASTWALTKNNWDDDLTNSTSGEFMAIHYRGTIGIGNKDGNDYYLSNYTGGEILSMKGEYTITDGLMILPTLALKMRDDAVQFSVEGLASNSDTWQLLVNHDKDNASDCAASDPTSPILAYTPTNVQISSTNLRTTFYNAQWMVGAVNGYDLSFCGRLDSGNDEASINYMFILKNTVTDKKYYFNYKPSPFVKLAGKNAYLLPPLTLDGDGVTLATGCLWKKL